MKLPYCPWFDLLSAEIQVVVDVTVEWEDGDPYLVANDVLERGGKVSLIRCGSNAMERMAYLIMDMAENCPKLLAEAVEQDVFERAA